MSNEGNYRGPCKKGEWISCYKFWQEARLYLFFCGGFDFFLLDCLSGGEEYMGIHLRYTRYARESALCSQRFPSLSSEANVTLIYISS